MGVVISLRDSDEKSYYKEMICEMINTLHPDELLISSGYFQNSNTYSVINDICFDGTPVIDSFRNVETITIVGHKDDNNSNWHPQFVSFVNDLRLSLPGCTINAYYDTGFHWHAKELIMLCNGVAVAGALGSSNFTRPAMGHTPRAAAVPLATPINRTIVNHNRETDVYIFNDDYAYAALNMVRAANENGTVSLIYATIDPRLYAGRNESRILREQYDIIMHEALQAPFVQLP